VEASGPPGPGEERSTAEQLTEADEDYQLKRKHYQQRRQELEEIKQGKRKRMNQYTQSRDEDNAPILALPTVIQGIKATPALKNMLPDVVLPQLAQDSSGAVNSPMPLQQGSGGKDSAAKQPGTPAEVAGGTFYVPPETTQAGARTDARKEPERRHSNAPYSGPERRQNTERRRPEPDYGHRAEPATHKLGGKVAQMESSNTYGLKSRSEMNFPQAYAPVSREMWEKMSEEQQAQALRLQAIAQEKVGFEKSAPKFFIEDFDPNNPNAPTVKPGSQRSAPVTEVSLAAPRLIMGGMLIGAGGLLLALALGNLLPASPGIVYGIAIAGLVGGVLMTLNPRG
jgi:hypothetical protein